jgi:hypothetical protein
MSDYDNRPNNNLPETEELRARVKELDAVVDELTMLLDFKKETIVEMQNAYETLDAHDEMLLATLQSNTLKNKAVIEYCYDHLDKMWAATIVGMILDCDFRDSKEQADYFLSIYKGVGEF